MPEYNNDPSNDATQDPNSKFEPDPKEDIHDICGIIPDVYILFRRCSSSYAMLLLYITSR